MIQVPVTPELNPFLVSSLDNMVWVERASKTGMVWAAFRSSKGWEKNILSQVTDRGKREGWGNVHPLTPEGVAAAVAYVRSFGLEAEVLAGPRVTFQVDGMSKAPWVPAGFVVVVPRDRMYLGTVHQVSPTQVAVVVHNPSRGIAIATSSVAQDKSVNLLAQ